MTPAKTKNQKRRQRRNNVKKSPKKSPKVTDLPKLLNVQLKTAEDLRTNAAKLNETRRKKQLTEKCITKLEGRVHKLRDSNGSPKMLSKCNRGLALKYEQLRVLTNNVEALNKHVKNLEWKLAKKDSDIANLEEHLGVVQVEDTPKTETVA